jgi:hypothetical protein
VLELFPEDNDLLRQAVQRCPKSQCKRLTIVQAQLPKITTIGIDDEILTRSDPLQTG